MPITGFASYGPTMAEFSTNWIQANTELGATPLVLAGDYTQSQFEIDRTGVLGAIFEVSNFARIARDAASYRDLSKIALNTRAKQFRGAIQSKIIDPGILKELPVLPQLGLDLSKFSEPLKAMSRIWEFINGNPGNYGLSGPILLQGDYNQAQFQADVQNLTALYDGAASAEQQVGFSRSRRNAATSAIYERMKQYRVGAKAALPASSPALQNLPRLTPEAGTTPPPLVVTGAWDAALQEAVFHFAASTAPNVLKLQARGCTGASYKNNDEEIIADLTANATNFQTTWGLTAPGSKIAVKIYVMTTTGNENGGKAAKIVRPVT